MCNNRINNIVCFIECDGNLIMMILIELHSKKHNDAHNTDHTWLGHGWSWMAWKHGKMMFYVMVVFFSFVCIKTNLKLCYKFHIVMVLINFSCTFFDVVGHNMNMEHSYLLCYAQLFHTKLKKNFDLRLVYEIKTFSPGNARQFLCFFATFFTNNDRNDRWISINFKWNFHIFFLNLSCLTGLAAGPVMLCTSKNVFGMYQYINLMPWQQEKKMMRSR